MSNEPDSISKMNRENLEHYAEFLDRIASSNRQEIIDLRARLAALVEAAEKYAPTHQCDCGKPAFWIHRGERGYTCDACCHDSIARGADPSDYGEDLQGRALWSALNRAKGENV